MVLQKQMQRVSLDAGNWIAWIAVSAIMAFASGWIAHAMSKPLLCWWAA